MKGVILIVEIYTVVIIVGSAVAGAEHSNKQTTMYHHDDQPLQLYINLIKSVEGCGFKILSLNSSSQYRFNRVLIQNHGLYTEGISVLLDASSQGTFLR